MSEKQRKFGDILTKREFCVLLFFVSLFLFNWPFLSKIDSQPGKMFFYLFYVWIIIIFFLFLISRASAKDHSEKDQSSKKGKT